MTTAKDLFIIAMDPKHSVGQGDLSLALAGAELIDLIAAGAATVASDRVVPDKTPRLDDRLLGEAAAAVSGHSANEKVEDWLWRRGKELSATYQAALEEEGELTRKRGGRLPFGSERVEPVDTPAHRRAADRWREGEPVLTALASAVGVESERFDAETRFADEAVTSVVAAVHDAVMELEAVRQRRSLEKAAFANIWRGP